MEARPGGARDGPAGTSRWRPGATVDELLRAAEGMEAMAEMYVGVRRAELQAAADELRELAWRHGGPAPSPGRRRFARAPQPVPTPARA